MIPDPILERLKTYKQPRKGATEESIFVSKRKAETNAQLVAAIKAQEAEKRAGK